MQNPLFRRWLILLTVCIVPALTVAASPQWAEGVLVDMTDDASDVPSLKVLAEQRVELNAECDLVLQRIKIKEGILDEIESGQLTLHAAAEKYKLMDRERPAIQAVLYPPERLGSEDEIAAATVIRHLRTRNQINRKHIGDTIARLEQTFEIQFGYALAPE